MSAVYNFLYFIYTFYNSQQNAAANNFPQCHMSEKLFLLGVDLRMIHQ